MHLRSLKESAGYFGGDPKTKERSELSGLDSVYESMAEPSPIFHQRKRTRRTYHTQNQQVFVNYIILFICTTGTNSIYLRI